MTRTYIFRSFAAVLISKRIKNHAGEFGFQAFGDLIDKRDKTSRVAFFMFVDNGAVRTGAERIKITVLHSVPRGALKYRMYHYKKF
jgi:hypothetical protein